MSSDYSGKVHEVIETIVCEKIIKFLQRYCTCIKFKKNHELEFKIVNYLNTIEDALRNFKEIEIDSLKVIVRKKFLRKEVYLVIKNREFNKDEAITYLSRIRSIIEWYNQDCSLNIIISETIQTNDFNLITFINRNLNLINKYCEECTVAELDYSELESYVVNGIKKAFNEYLTICRSSD